MKHRSILGFTLIELMIVVVAVGILAAIALPSYRSSIERSRLATAKGILFEASQSVERSYSLNNSYPTDIPAALKTAPKTGEGTVYFNITYATDGAVYTLKAEIAPPYAPADCQTLILRSAGQKFAYNDTGHAITASTPATSSNPSVDTDCWNR